MKTLNIKSFMKNEIPASRRIFILFLVMTLFFSLLPEKSASAATVDMTGAKVVTDIQGFNSALAAGGNVKIILDADITLPQGTGSRIPATVTRLTIDGQGRYSLYDGYWASATANTSYTTNNLTPSSTSAAVTSITFQNMNLYVGNQAGLAYDVYSTNFNKLTVTFENCKIQCVRLLALYGCNVIIRDCDITSTKKPNTAATENALEIVRARNISVGGETKIVRATSNGNSPLFDMTPAGNGSLFVIEEGAIVEMNGGTSTAGFLYPASRTASVSVEFVVRRNATFVYKGKHFRTGADSYQLWKFTCEEASTCVLAVEGPLLTNEGIINLTNGNTSGSVLEVKRGSSLYVMLQNSTANYEEMPIWFDGGGIKLDRPQKLVFYNGGQQPALAVYQNGKTFELNGVRSLKMYTCTSAELGAAKFSGVTFDFSNPISVGADGEVQVNYNNNETPTRLWEKYGTSRTSEPAHTNTAFNIKGYLDTSTTAGTYGNRTTTNVSFTKSGTVFENYNGEDNIVTGAETTLGQIYFNNAGNFQTKIVEVIGTYSDPPKVKDVVEGMRTVEGTGSPGSEIWINFPDGSHQFATVNLDGTWSATCANPFIRGNNVYVTQRELVDGQFNDESPEILVNVLRKTVRLVPTNTAKIYTADMLGVAVNINEFDPERFEVKAVDYIVFDQPGYINAKGVNNNPEDYTYFDGIYDSWNGQKGAVTMNRTVGGVDDYSGSIGAIGGNCEVWVRAKLLIDSETVYVYDSFEYKNIFEPVTIQARGMMADVTPADVLYAYENISKPDGTPYGVYGIPYNIDGSVCVDPIGGYDTVQLSGKAYYAFYWTASFKGGPLSYSLTLNQNFLTDNQHCDDGNQLRYTLDYEKDPAGWRNVTVEFVNESGGPLEINSAQTGVISVPIDVPGGNASTNFYNYGGRYKPPHDDNNMPIGWVVGSAYPGHYKAQSSFSDPSFNPQFSNVVTQSLYIVYKVGQFTVLEKYTDDSDDAIDNDRPLIYDAAFPEDYVGAPKKIGGYVPVGYTVEGSSGADAVYAFSFDDYLDAHPGTLPTVNQYNIFPGLLIDGPDLVPPGGRGTVTVTYIYAKDSNNDGIPDTDATSVNVSWYGYKITSNIPAVLKEHITINSRTGHSIDVSNRYPGLGDDNERVVFPIYHDYGGTWIFDKWRADNDSTRSVLMDTTQADMVFVYGYSTDGVTLDNRLYVTEKYHVLSSSDDNKTSLGTPFPAATIAAGVQYKAKTAAYTKTPPHIPGYVCLGYRIEDESGNPIGLSGTPIGGAEINTITYTNGSALRSVSVSIAGNPERYTVVFLYREEAKPVSIAWIGETYGGTEIAIASAIIGGWAGEDITSLIANSAAIDTDVWQYQSDTVPGTVTLSDTAQSYEYRYKELINFATITVRGVSTDDKLAYEYSVTRKLTDAAFDVTAWPIPSYRIDGYTVTDAYGKTLGSGNGDACTANPSHGSMTITFAYVPTITTVLVKILDYDTGKELDSHTFTDAVIGEKYGVKALYQNGWVLLGDLLQSVTVQAGANRIEFYYQKSTGNVSVFLREDGPGGQIIKAESENVAFGAMQPIDIPDLSSSYYTAISTEETIVDFTGPELTPSTVEYYYKKDMMDVVITAVDEDGTVLSTERHDNAARKGEMYNAVAPVVNWHTLTEAREKTVYANPQAADNTIIVTFTYKADKIGDITVRYFYVDENGDEAELYAYSGKGVVGGKFTAVAMDFDGFELIGAETEQEIIVADANAVEFEYADLRHTVTVETILGNAAAQDETAYKVVSGDTVNISIPYKSGYVAKSYVLNGDDDTKVDIGDGFDKLTLDDVGDDITVTFIYVTVEAAANEQYVLLTIKGMTGSQVHYSYIRRVANSDTAITLLDGADVFAVPGYTLLPSQSFSVTPNQNKDVVFEYATLATTVTVKMTDGLGDNVAGSFAVAATVGQPLSYYAPDVPGYYLTGSALGSVNPVAANGVSEIVFTYARIASNVTIVAKEGGAAGRVLGVFEVASPTEGTELYDVPDLSAAYYTTSSDKVSISYDGINSVSAEVYYTKELVSVAIEAIDYLTNAPVEMIAPLTNQRRGETVAINAPGVNDYVLVGGATQTVIADGVAQAVFKYRTLEADEVMVKAEDAEGNILQSYILKGTLGETISAGPPVILGFKTSETAKDALVGTDKTIVFVYAKDVVTVTIRALDAGSAELDSYAAEAARGGDYTAYAPHIPGYVLNDSSVKRLTGLTGNAQISFSYNTAQDYVDNSFVKVTVRGVASGTAADLYSYSTQRQKGSGGYTVEALPVNGYTLLTATPATVTVGNENVTQTFEYATLATTVMVKMTDGLGNNVAGSFAVAATVGQPLSYYAPDVPGYYLVSSALGSVNPVAANGVSEIVFTYARIASNVTIVAKEGGAAGRVLGVFEVASPTEGTELYDVPDLSAAYYTTTSDKVSITYDGINSVSAEVYYTKELVSVAIEAVDYLTNVPVEMIAPLTGQRQGETVAINAPGVNDYVLVGGATQTVIADGAAKAVFKYRTLGADEVMVKAEDAAGNILQSYILRGTVGETISAGPPVILGFKTSETAEDALVGTDKTIVFVYAKDVVTVTIRALDAGGAQLDSYTAEAARGGDYTAYAPHIPGYVLNDSSVKRLTGLTGNAQITFSYSTAQDYAGNPEPAREADVTFKYLKKSNNNVIKTEILPRQQVGTAFTFGTASAFNEGGRKYSRDASTPAVISITISDANEVLLYYNDTGAESTIIEGEVETKYTTAVLTVQGIDRDTKKVIYSQSVTVVVGSTETVTPPSISYYTLDSSYKSTQRITIKAGENKVTFGYNYLDITPTVIVNSQPTTNTIAMDYTYTDMAFMSGNTTVDMLETSKHIKYISGYEGGTVKPDTAITRAEVAAIFYRLLKDSAKNGAVSGKFTDISSNAWYAQAVNCLASLGILKGYEDGTFHPDKNITRAEFATIVSRFDRLSESNSVIFADVPNAHWASAYVNSAYLKGWISGYPNGNFEPAKSTTRAEAVKIINAMLNRRIELSDVTANVSQYTDLSRSHWAYCAIIEASNEHTSIRKDNGYEVW